VGQVQQQGSAILIDGGIAGQRLNLPLAIILTVSLVIAAIAPFDVGFVAVTFGSPVLRVMLMAALVMIGAWSASQVGLRLIASARSALIGAIGAILVAGYVVCIDCYLFRSVVPESYAQFFEQMPLGERFAYFMLRAFNENVIYRLFVFATALCLLSKLTRVGAREMAPIAILAVMVATQALNIGMNVTAFLPGPISPLVLTYEALRYVVPGVIWAWLFWRFGFLTAEIASVGCHLFLQPALGILL